MTPAFILVVDDDARIAELLADFLSGLGHEVAAAHDIGEAVAVLGGRRPDLIISDLHLPGGSAVELLARLRPDGAPPAPAIVISGSSADEAPDLARAPRVSYLEKPVDFDRLRAEIERALRGPC